MPSVPSDRPRRGGARSNDLHEGTSGLELRRQQAPELDEVDEVLLAELSADARIPNNALADRAGIAPSTCLARVRRLREAGVIRGFHADVDPGLAGRPIQAMILVRMQGRTRARLGEFQRHLAGLPGVLDVYLLGGAHDFFVHVAAPTPDSLNSFVIDHLSVHPDVAFTETNLVFRHARAARFR